MTRYEPVPLVYRYVEPRECDKEKAPLIFMHGLTASKEYWYETPEVAANSTKRRAYVIDSRNHGESPWSDVFNFDCNVDDILHFMDTIGAPKAILIGHSMGGITAIKTALREPERVERIVVEDVGVRRLQDEVIQMVRQRIALMKVAIEKMPPGLDEVKARKFIFDLIYDALPPEIKKYMRVEENCYMIPLRPTEDGRWRFKSNLEGIDKAAQNASGIMTESTGLYQGLALFIYGLQSPFRVGSDEPNIKRLFPNAEFVAVENATHTVHNDCPEVYTEALVAFLLKE
ncbi:hypothetical protein TNIN_363861 [Trichonephila inaurata madagascariensis]|uniref:sn-1-specific diacylglycerol lipase ABHD11 n=1 Tax=Trichonephila inaurata madagascariensis TaxID=2747483 RepID=A0A8X7BZH0_9ARAC|nr:hypothetical protein TNIN_363861 [Trichonephila inaurata madagascariensis]